MRKRILILDGYNILHRAPAWKHLPAQSLECAREALLAYCRQWMRRRGDVWQFQVVFDGDSSVAPEQTSSGPGVRVMYSATGQTADDRILVALRECGEGVDRCVVSDDNEVTRCAKRLGAHVMPVMAFCTRLRDREANAADDALPGAAAKSITDELRELWGG